MQGVPMASFLPFHLPSIDRSPALLSWLQSWIPLLAIRPLQATDWYERSHGLSGGTYSSSGLWRPTFTTEDWFLWDIVPGAAMAALDQLSTSRLKCPHLNHVFICPKLLTQYWRKKLHKICDLVLEIPAGACPFWPLTMHEPSLIGLTLRFTLCSPWQLRQSPSILEMERQMRNMWRSPHRDERPLLLQLCRLPGLLESM
jgi:hypothetical protein